MAGQSAPGSAGMACLFEHAGSQGEGGQNGEAVTCQSTGKTAKDLLCFNDF